MMKFWMTIILLVPAIFCCGEDEVFTGKSEVHLVSECHHPEPKKITRNLNSPSEKMARAFRESFHGIAINGEKFWVKDQFLGWFSLSSLSGRTAMISIFPYDSKQEAQDDFAEFEERSKSLGEIEQIDFADACRQIKWPTGAELGFVDDCLFVRISVFGDASLDLSPAAKEIDALLHGNAEFLPKDEAEIAKILEIKRQKDEARRARERERQEESKRLRLAVVEQGALPTDFLNERSRGGEKELLAAFEKAGFAVPAFPRDLQAWKKLTYFAFSESFDDVFVASAHRSIYRVEEDFSGANSSNHLVRTFEISFENPDETDTRIFGEIVFAGTPDDAWKSAIYLRRKYANFLKTKNLDDFAGTPMLLVENVVKTTKQNAFPQLGDMNLSWTGFGDGNDKSGESHIVFIRGTTVISICGRVEKEDCFEPISILAFARKIDALLCGDVPVPVK